MKGFIYDKNVILVKSNHTAPSLLHAKVLFLGRLIVALPLHQPSGLSFHSKTPNTHTHTHTHTHTISAFALYWCFRCMCQNAQAIFRSVFPLKNSQHTHTHTHTQAHIPYQASPCIDVSEVCAKMPKLDLGWWSIWLGVGRSCFCCFLEVGRQPWQLSQPVAANQSISNHYLSSDPKAIRQSNHA